jgi:hypothetical protein
MPTPASRRDGPRNSRLGKSTRKTHLITNQASAAHWHRLLMRTPFRDQLPVVLFSVPEFTPSENTRLATLAELQRTRCGCQLSGLLMTATLLAQVGYYCLTEQASSKLNGSHWAFLAVTMVTALLVGKVTTTVSARWHLMRVARYTVTQLDTAHTRIMARTV